MATSLFPKETEGRWYRHEAHTILDDMIKRGNRVAEARKKELLYLETIFDAFTERINREGAAPLTLFDQQDVCSSMMPRDEDVDEFCGAESMAGQSSRSTSANFEMQHRLLVSSPAPPIGLDLSDTMGISSFDFYSIVEQMAPQDGYDLGLH